MPTRPFLRILLFIVASATVGLAAAFVAVMVRPELIARRTPAPAAQPATAAAPVVAPVVQAPPVELPRATNSYAEAVQRAAPAVVGRSDEPV